jgi:uncharacterized protein (DUF58 family)
MRVSRLRRFIRWVYRYRSVRLTPEGMRFALLAVAIGVAAINTGNNLLYLLLAMMLSLIVLSGVLSEQCLKRLSVSRRLPEHLFANQPATATFTVTNRKRWSATFSLRVMDMIEDVPVDRGVRLLHLGPRASAVLPYPLLVTRRGPYRIEGVKLLTRFPFGLFVKAARVPLPSEAVVYPEVKPLPDALVRELAGIGSDQAAARRGRGIGLYNLRAYQAGDDSRSIHWKTSARQATLMVRETEAEDQRRVFVALSTAVPYGVSVGAGSEVFPDQDFERAVTLAASLVTLFHERGYAVGLLAGSQGIPPETGLTHLYRMLRVLGLCAPARPAERERALAALRSLDERTAHGEVTVLVLPWRDPRTQRMTGSVTRVLYPSELP